MENILPILAVIINKGNLFFCESSNVYQGHPQCVTSDPLYTGRCKIKTSAIVEAEHMGGRLSRAKLGPLQVPCFNVARSCSCNSQQIHYCENPFNRS